MATKTFKIGLSNTDKQNMAQEVYERLLALTFSEYDSTKTYNAGDFVIYNDLLYKCLADNTTGTWDSTKWQQATLQDLVDEIADAVASVDGKANTEDLLNGTLIPSKSLSTYSIEPVSEESGATQETPFVIQGTGTNNNTDETPTSPVAKQLEKQGNSVVINQKLSVANLPSSQTINGLTITKNNNGSLTISGLPTDRVTLYLASQPSLIVGHTYLFYNGKSSLSFHTSNWDINSNATYNYAIGVLQSNSGTVLIDIFTTVWTTEHTETFFLKIIDLTQWFNGDIPQDLLNNPDHFSWYYNSSLAYNTGSLENGNGRYLVTTGRNQWDEEWEAGWLTSDGQNSATYTDRIRSKNYIRVIPNTKYHYQENTSSNVRRICYYDKNKVFVSYEDYKESPFIIPHNCEYIRFATGSNYGATYKNDITISLYYETGEEYGKHYPYEEPKVYDTGNEVLRKAGSVKDYKTPDGTIHRLVGTRAYQSEDENDNSVITDGTTTYYQLATPTTEQGTPFAENIEVNDYGTMYWLDDNEALVGVPQGCKIFYPADYVLLMDDLNNYTNGSVSNLALKTDLLPKLPSSSADGTYTLKAIKIGDTITYTWVADEPSGE